MKTSCFIAIPLVALVSCSDGSVTVKEDADVFTATLPKFEGTHHGDGVADVTVRGVVLDRKSQDPLAGVTFRVEPTRIFADFFNEKVHFTTPADGKFEFPMQVGAAIAMGGKKDGEVYQTAKAKLIAEKEGYEPITVLIDYQMPPLKIMMKRKRA